MPSPQSDFFNHYIRNERLREPLPKDSAYYRYMNKLSENFGFVRHAAIRDQELLRENVRYVGMRLIQYAVDVLPSDVMLRSDRIRNWVPYTVSLDLRYVVQGDSYRKSFRAIVTIFWLKTKLAGKAAFPEEIHTTLLLNKDIADNRNIMEALFEAEDMKSYGARCERIKQTLSSILAIQRDARTPALVNGIWFEISPDYMKRKEWKKFEGLIREKFEEGTRHLLLGIMEDKKLNYTFVACDLSRLEMFTPDKGLFEFADLDSLLAYLLQVTPGQIIASRFVNFLFA